MVQVQAGTFNKEKAPPVPACTFSEYCDSREISLTDPVLFIPATAKPQISNETARIILLRSDLKYPLKAANFAVIYCFITPTQKGLPTTKTTHRSHGAQRCLFLTKPSKKL